MLLDKYLKIEEELFPKNFFYRHSKLVAPDLIGCHLIKKNKSHILKSTLINSLNYFSQLNMLLDKY